MTGTALKEELKERQRGRKKEGDSVRGRRSPCLHTLSSSQDPLFPVLLDTERCPLEVLLFILLLCFRTSVALQVKVKRQRREKNPVNSLLSRSFFKVLLPSLIGMLLFAFQNAHVIAFLKFHLELLVEMSRRDRW